MANFGDYYLNGSNLITATAVFTDSSLTTLAAVGYYSDGVVGRYQTASVGLGPILTCPQCANSAPSTIQPVDSLPGKYSIYTKFGSAVGAIKVSVTNLVNNSFVAAPFGLFFINTNTQERYGGFSSRLTTSITGVIEAPLIGEPQYFYHSTTSFCSNWSATNMEFNRFTYNTQSDNYEYVTDQPVITTNANQIPVAINSGSGQSKNNSLFTYIPKAAVEDFILLSEFYLPCSTPLPDPTVTISAPAVLGTIKCSPGSPTDHATACAQPFDPTTPLHVEYFHGPATTSASSIINVGDFMFQDANAVGVLFDGYYKTRSTNLHGGLPTQNGTFRTEKGVVTEIQSC